MLRLSLNAILEGLLRTLLLLGARGFEASNPYYRSSPGPARLRAALPRAHVRRLLAQEAPHTAEERPCLLRCGRDHGCDRPSEEVHDARKHGGRRRRGRGQHRRDDGDLVAGAARLREAPPPFPPRTDWTRLVPPPVLTGLSAGIKEVGQGNQEPIPFGRVPPRTDRTRRVPPRTKRTRRVPSPLLTGRAASPPWRKSSAGSLGEPTLRAGFKRVLHQHTAHCERRGSGGGHGKEREGQHAPEPGARRACAALAPTGGAQGSATRAVLVSRRRAGTGPVPVLIPHGALLLSRWEEASPPPSE